MSAFVVLQVARIVCLFIWSERIIEGENRRKRLIIIIIIFRLNKKISPFFSKYYILKICAIK